MAEIRKGTYLVQLRTLGRVRGGGRWEGAVLSKQCQYTSKVIILKYVRIYLSTQVSHVCLARA